MSELLKHARRYRDLGWSIFPVGEGSKAPAVKAWKKYQSEPPTARQVDGWWRRGKRGVAVVLGEVSGGLMCRDFDTKGSYEAWCAEEPALAASLPTAQTGGGYHVYFRGDAPTVASEIGSGCLYTGDGELRVSGCYCVLPPSLHEVGQNYSWVREPDDATPYLDGVCDKFLSSCNLFTQDTHGYTGYSGYSMDLEGPQNCNCKAPAAEWVSLCVTQSLPDRPGTRRDCLVKFWRKCMVHPEVRAMSVSELEPWVKEWHARALPNIRTKTLADTMVDFASIHRDILYAEGDGRLSQATVAAMQGEPCHGMTEMGGIELERLALLCRELQRLHGEEPFFLSCRMAGKIIGVSHTQAHKWLEYLEKFPKIIRTVEKGNRSSGKASTYLYVWPL